MAGWTQGSVIYSIVACLCVGPGVYSSSFGSVHSTLFWGQLLYGPISTSLAPCQSSRFAAGHSLS